MPKTIRELADKFGVSKAIITKQSKFNNTDCNTKRVNSKLKT